MKYEIHEFVCKYDNKGNYTGIEAQCQNPYCENIIDLGFATFYVEGVGVVERNIKCHHCGEKHVLIATAKPEKISKIYLINKMINYGDSSYRVDCPFCSKTNNPYLGTLIIKQPPNDKIVICSNCTNEFIIDGYYTVENKGD